MPENDARAGDNFGGEVADEFWFWAGADGSLKTVEQGELETALNKGAIPPRAFVWRQGWGEWLRAQQVKELAHAVPVAERVATVFPKMSPDATHPPPVPRDGGLKLEPIVPVASSPENEKPGTQLLVEVELDDKDFQVVKPAAPARKSTAPPPPSRRSAPPSQPPRPTSSVSKQPIVSIASTPLNDKPNTDLMIDVVVDDKTAPPADKWQDVSASPKLEPIKPVDSSPHNEPITGLISDDEIQVIEGSAGATARAIPGGKPLPNAQTLKFGAIPAPTAVAPTPAVPRVEPAPISVPSLDKLAEGIEAKRPKPSPVIAVSAPKPAPVEAAQPPAYAPPHPPAPVHKPGSVPAPGPMVPSPMINAAPITPEREPDSEAPTRLVDPIIPVSEPENDAPTQIQLSPPGEAAPLPSWSADVDAEMAAGQEWPHGAPAAQARPQQYSSPAYASYPPPKKSSLPLVIGIFGVLGLGAVLAGGALLYFKPWEKPEAKPVQSAAPVVATETKSAPTRCVVQKDARRLASSIVVGTPPYVAPAAGAAGKVAIGFAESDAVGAGILLDPATLDLEKTFTSPAGTKVIGVVPMRNKAGFTVDRETPALGIPHTIAADSPFVVGFSRSGYSRSTGPGEPDLIWSEVARDKATEARVESVDGVGHAVTFRTAGKIRIGWLKPDGSKKTALGTVDTGGAKVGNPAIGDNGDSLLVAFAAREADTSPWTVQLASAKNGELPAKAQRFDIPSGGPGGDVIAPVVAGLSGGRWLVQWTEGGSGERTVRAITLDDKLAPIGEPLRISAPGKEAGQGEIAIAGENAAALHLVKADRNYELWATALSCK